MIYILRHPKTHKEIRTQNTWKAKQYRLKGYRLVNKYDPKETQNCKA
jgi:hypothetical protein